MTSTLTKALLVACLAVPALASAHNGGSQHNALNSDSDSYSFALSTTSDVSINYSWSDLLTTQTTPGGWSWSLFGGWHQYPSTTTTTEYNATSLLWSLTGPTTQSGSLTSTDLTGDFTGNGKLSFAGLLAGVYELTLTGNWKNINPSSVGGAGNMTKPDVDLVGSSYSAVAVAAPVPEPESYAMFAAGLGLMGFIARRRSKA